jgi:hypothetical protein
MMAKTHDPTNVRTLDVSGNGLHFRFGDGITSNTYPTKNPGQRGYTFDGSNDRLVAIANQTNAITQGTWVVFYAPTNQAATYDVYSHYDFVNLRAVILTTSTQVQFYCGDAISAASLTIALPIGQAIFAAGYRTTDGFRRLYVNGLLGTPNNTGTSTPSTIVATNPHLGGRSGVGNMMPGRIFWYGHWEYALSELQLRDLEARLRRQLNDV